MMEDKKKNRLWGLFEDKQKYSTMLLIGTLMLGILLFGTNRFATGHKEIPAVPAVPVGITELETEINRAERELEHRLQTVLSQIDGAGQVDVSIFLATSTKYEYAINVSANNRIIDEKDQGGGVRLTTENNSSDQFVLIRGNQTGQEHPVIIQEQSPQIQGILIVADGAKDAKVKAQLLRAVQTGMGVALHRIQVLPREGR